uniref:Uncharacterized protein n=1 Tax=Cuerna arida TaxID=1464854 RepID=A0A1B6FDC0_9HEMI
MAPTVCVAEMSERPFSLEDHLRKLSALHCIGERRRSRILQSRKKSLRHTNPSQLYCHKIQMGLVVEECHAEYDPDTDTDSNSSTNQQWGQQSLVNITLRTLALLRRNQQLQHKLSLLQAETRAFVESVLTHPPSPTPDK